MAILRATQFFNGLVTGSTPTTIYTVPTGHRIVVHGISLYNEDAANNAVTVFVPSTFTLAAMLLAGAGSTGARLVLTPYMVFNAGQIINCVCSAGKTASVNLSGTYLFV